MPPLAEIQARMVAALLNDTIDALVEEVVEDGTPARDRIEIYRDSVLEQLKACLAGIYPVAGRLIGPDAFLRATRDFIRAHPPRDSSLIFYGETFPWFLESLAVGADQPWLGDVARLEWTCHLACHEADAAQADLARLNGLAPELWPRARVRFQPSLCLLRSDYPLLRIWRTNRPSRAGPPAKRFTPRETFISVCRPDLEVEIREHNAATFRFLETLQRKQPLEDAYRAALALDSHFDPEPPLTEWLAERLIVELDTCEATGNDMER